MAYNVRDIQTRLKAAGFDPGPIDGVMGPRTRAAIRAFQQAKGLTVDGVVGPQTWGALTGGGGGGAAPAAAAAGPDPAALYPQMAWAVNHGELGPILRQAAAEGWDAARLQGAIHGSNWWRTTLPATRAFDTLMGQDPNAAEDQIQKAILKVQSIGVAMGHDPYGNPGWTRHMAYQMVRFGWDDEVLKRAMAAELGGYRGEAGLTGDIGMTFRRVKQMASDWGVPIADDAVWTFAKQLQSGQMTDEGVQTYFMGTAKSLYPSISGAIDQGISVRQYFSPYIQLAVQELGINEADINLADTKWNRALNHVADPSKPGVRQPMNLNDWQKTLRTDPMYGWDFTPKAKEQAAQFATQTLERMGMI